MAINFEELTSLQKQCLTRIIDLLFGKNYISANLSAISDSFYTIEYKDEYGNAPPIFIGKPTHGFTEIRTSNFPMPLLSRTVNKLVEQGFLERVYRNDDDAFQLSDKFVEEAHRIFSEGSATFRDDIPAADRFVSIGDNQPDVTSAKAALDELSDAIRKTNDPLTTHPEDRIQLSKEVDAIKALISQPRIHVAALYDAVNSSSTLKFLVRQAAAGIVQRAAVKAMESLTTLWQHVSSLL
jgi:hypothetical protein